jgi:DNA-binding transcriptional LysR family regulator
MIEIVSRLEKNPTARSLDWNLLRVFLVIAEERSISRAADVLQRTQPAISTALKRLEQNIGTRLVTRSATTFELTDAGTLLHRECKEVFNTICHIPNLLSDQSETLSGTLSLTMASHIVSDIIDETLRIFHERYPQVTLDISLVTSSSVIERVFNRSINFGICLASNQVSGLDYFHLYKEHFAFFCGPLHRFFRKQNLVLADLAGESAVSFKVFASSEALHTITGMYRQARMAIPFAGISDNLEEVRRMIIAGVGIGALPVHVMQRDARDGLLWQLPLDNVIPIDVYLVSSPKAQLSRAEQAFTALLREVTAAKPLSKRTYPPKYAERPVKRIK